MARLDRLGPARELAQIGAVIGRDFSYALLRCGGRNGRYADCKLPWTGSSMPTFSWCRACRQMRTIASSTRSFRTLLTRICLKSRRLILHRRVGETLRDQFAGTAAAEPELLAHHFSQAGMTRGRYRMVGQGGTAVSGTLGAS